MKIFLSIFFRYFIIIAIAFLFDCVFNSITKPVVYNFVENILFAILLASPHLIISNQRLNKLVFIVLYVIFSVSICIETIYYYLFKTTFSSSAIFVMLDTNSEETKEFLGFYIDNQIIIFIVIIFVTILMTLLRFKKLDFINSNTPKAFKLKVLGVFIGLSLFLKMSSLIIYNLPYMAVRASVEYYIESKKLDNYADNKIGNFNNVSRNFDSEEEVYVIIIGESTARGHLGIYDYYRNTTPLLKSIEHDLLVYKRVISSDSYTIPSLTKALTLGNYENPEAKFEGSIIQLLNQAKFKTYWVSVQKPIGANDSNVTKIGLGAHKSYFLNIKNSKEKTILDEVLVDKLDEILQEEGNKKVVFLHTLGTHFNYRYRYSENFNFFNEDIPKSKFKKQAVYDEINAYDNAVRYTDYIISKVIKSTKKVDANSFVLYFSDHGEEVYENIEFSGHFREGNLTKNLYEIPMLLWRSDKYKIKKEIYPNLNSKYMIDDLFHSIADLVDIDATEVDSTRSIFNKYFKERKRIIRDTIDYDTFFN